MKLFVQWHWLHYHRRHTIASRLDLLCFLKEFIFIYCLLNGIFDTLRELGNQLNDIHCYIADHDQIHF